MSTLEKRAGRQEKLKCILNTLCPVTHRLVFPCTSPPQKPTRVHSEPLSSPALYTTSAAEKYGGHLIFALKAATSVRAASLIRVCTLDRHDVSHSRYFLSQCVHLPSSVRAERNKAREILSKERTLCPNSVRANAMFVSQ